MHAIHTRMASVKLYYLQMIEIFGMLKLMVNLTLYVVWSVGIALYIRQ